MIIIKETDANHSEDINIPNEPFLLNGKIIPSYTNGKWSYEVVSYSPEDVSEMCFPDENYDPKAMTDCLFLGAYDNGTCIGLAILQHACFKYLYLYDLKVNRAYRRKGIGKMLMKKASELAIQNGYRGIYTIGQDNNPGACLFYLNSGFYIGGLDTNVYRHTNQEGKADIIFYYDA